MAEAPAARGEKKQPVQSEEEHDKDKDESSDKKEGKREGEDDEHAIPEDSWFYLDTSQTPQGPFSWNQMSAWYKGGYLKADLPVMKAGEEDFTPLQQHAAFNSLLATAVPKFEFSQTAPSAYDSWMSTMTQQQQQQFSTLSAQQKMVKYQEYMATANFSLTSGRFQAVGGGVSGTPSVASARRVGGPEVGSAGRQLAHYFDIDAWQAQKQREKELGLKPKKVKNWRELKEARKERKQRNYVRGLLKD